MKKNNIVRLIILGFVTWLVPFLISFGFYDRTGNLNIPYGTFKCVMVVLSAITGMGALIYHFRYIDRHYGKEGFIAGVAWLFINFLLDILILIPMAGMTFFDYFFTIGLGYLQIPVICSAAGMLLEKKVSYLKS